MGSERKAISNKDGWTWYNVEDTIYLQSNLLSDNNFTHAFFTKVVFENSPKYLNTLISNDSVINRL